jgi:hypothetical protein
LIVELWDVTSILHFAAVCILVCSASTYTLLVWGSLLHTSKVSEIKEQVKLWFRIMGLNALCHAHW